jgi:hypothetical protein
MRDVSFVVEFVDDLPFQLLARPGSSYSVHVVGNCVELGDWARNPGWVQRTRLHVVNGNDLCFQAVISIPSTFDIRYKYVIYSEKDGGTILWEDDIPDRVLPSAIATAVTDTWNRTDAMETYRHPMSVLQHCKHAHAAERSALVSYCSLLAAASLVSISFTSSNTLSQNDSTLQNWAFMTGAFAFIWFVVGTVCTVLAAIKDGLLVAGLETAFATVPTDTGRRDVEPNVRGSPPLPAFLHRFESSPPFPWGRHKYQISGSQLMKLWRSNLSRVSSNLRLHSWWYSFTGVLFALMGTCSLIVSIICLSQVRAGRVSDGNGYSIAVLVVFLVSSLIVIFLWVFYLLSRDPPLPKPARRLAQRLHDNVKFPASDDDVRFLLPGHA